MGDVERAAPQSVGDVLSAFRREYHRMSSATASVVAARWDDLWSHVVEQAGRAVAAGEAPDTVRRRIEDLADLYRRCLCDPVQMHSLPLQSLVSGHLALQELWVDDLRRRDDDEAAAAPPQAPRLGPAWGAVLRSPELARRVLRGWSPDDPHRPAWQWRLPFSLYGAGTTDATGWGDPDARRRLSSAPLWHRVVLAAVGETRRLYLEPAAEAAAALDLGVVDWVAHRRRMLADHGWWCDVEGVAVGRCGWPRAPSGGLDDDDPAAAVADWWQPLADAEAALRDRLAAHTEAALVGDTLRAWARAWRLEPYLGLRFPPPFTAAIADVFLDVLHERHPLLLSRGVAWDRDVQRAAVERGATPHLHETWSRWLLLGVGAVPSRGDLCLGWDDEDHAVLDEAQGALTDRVWEHWAAKGTVASAWTPPPPPPCTPRPGPSVP